MNIEKKNAQELFITSPTAWNMSQFDSKIVHIEGGVFESYALTELGTLYGWGNSFGKKLTKLDAPVPMVELSVGGNHFLCRDAQGRVYGYGENMYVHGL